MKLIVVILMMLLAAAGLTVGAVHILAGTAWAMIAAAGWLFGLAVMVSRGLSNG